MSTTKRVKGDYTIETVDGQVNFVSNSTVIDGNLTVTGNAVLVGNINADKIFSGTSNVEIPLPNGNVTVGVGGVGNLAVFSTTGVSVAGNITGNYILGNGAFLTGVITSVANINNGTSNINIASPGSNIAVSVGGTPNVAIFATTGEYITGVLSASGNVTGGNIVTGGQVSASGNVTGGNIVTGGQISASGDISGNNRVNLEAIVQAERFELFGVWMPVPCWNIFP